MSALHKLLCLLGNIRQVCILQRYLKCHLSQLIAIFILLPQLSLISLSSHATYATPGQFIVTPKGSAGYTLPIQTPPGTADIEPRLALEYDSQAGDGLLGLGWRLNGLSQITRCPKTIAQDGARTGVNYSTTDKMCLDGQRLIAISGTYGANATEYRTEIANFSKIISYNTAGNGPAYFKVWTKSGQILEYGNTTDSRIEVAGLPTVRVWSLNKIIDTQGNYLTATYTEDNANGEFYISRIDYTGNATSTPTLATYASVQFSYATRVDSNTGYQNGAVLKSTKLLINVKTYTGTNLVKDYRVTYSNTGVNHTNASNQSDGSLITAIQECDGATTPTCLPAITFAWSGIKGGFAAPSFSNTPLLRGSEQFDDDAVVFGDINGDGKADMVYKYNSYQQIPPGTQPCYVGLSNGSTFVEVANWNVPHCPYAIKLGDINSDGLLDITSSAQLSTGNQFVTLPYTIPPPYPPWVDNHTYDPDTQSVDLNGDGFLDLITRTYATQYDGNRFTVALLNSSGYSPETIWATEGGYFGNSAAYYPDLNGDGLNDLVFQTANNQFWVSLSTGSGFAAHENWINFTGTLADAKISFADFNGDGLSDIVFNSGNNQFYVALSTGASFTASSIWSAQASNTVFTSALFSDVNGDGRADLVFQNATSQFYVGLSTGVGFAPATIWNSQVGDPQYTKVNTADVNGDGISDLIFQRTDNSFWISFASSTKARISSITGGLGAVTTITYKPLTDSSVYAKDSGALAATYPKQDTQSAKFVVASVSNSDGIGGAVTTNYTYGGDKNDLSGRGSLGFRWAKATIPDSSINLTTFYRQDYPYIGFPLQTEKRTNSGTLVSVTSNIYVNALLGSAGTQSQFPYLSRFIEKSYELDGNLIQSRFTDNQYDAYGNLLQAVTTSHDGFVKTINNTYTNNTTDWILGKLVRSSVASTSPDAGTSNPYPNSVFSITALSADKPEGLNAQVTAYTFTVSRSDVAGTASVNWALTGSGANPANASDFMGNALPSGTLAFTEGQASLTITVNVQGDSAVEPDEGFTVTISNPSTLGAASNPVLDIASAFGIIRNDDIASFVFNATISVDTLNYNLKNAAIAAGWNQTSPLNASITVNSGIYVGSASTANPGFDTGAGFPTGSVLQLINNGYVVGAGGKGGIGATYYVPASAGLSGGPALKAQSQLIVTNNGVIGGGMGGQGGGIRYVDEVYNSSNDDYTFVYYIGCSGNGGRGFTGGLAGNSQVCYGGVTAQNGTKIFGGAWGSAGSTGISDVGVAPTGDVPAPGGSGGAATIGSTNINWLVVGSRYGALN